MVDISLQKYKWHSVETGVDNFGIFCLNEKRVEEGLDHKNVWMTTGKYFMDHRKHRYEQENVPKNKTT